MDTSGLSSWIEVCERAYASNLRFFRRLVGADVELSVVVKSNAYGHGLELVAALAAGHGADSFCVHSLEEALRLRRAGFSHDVLIMGHVPLARLDRAVAEGFRLVLFNRASAERLATLAADAERPVRVHLEIETGTHRQGIDEHEIGWFIDHLRRHPRLEAEGVYTHFADIEDTTDRSYARSQLERFERLVEHLRGAGLGVAKRHCACSAATLVLPQTHFEMIRLGVSQYGLWPSKETLLSYGMAHRLQDGGGLQPVLTWKTRVSQLKQVPAGCFIGYGRSYQTTRDTRIAVLPIGYADGYDRGLSNQAHVLVRGRRAPVRGRVCMNLTMVDVTDVPGVELEDEVVLLGRQRSGDDADAGQEIRAGYLADLIGTLHYEVVARLGSELPRIVVGR